MAEEPFLPTVRELVRCHQVLVTYSAAHLCPLGLGVVDRLAAKGLVWRADRGPPPPGTARPPSRFCASVFPRSRPTQRRPGRAPFARRSCRADSDVNARIPAFSLTSTRHPTSPMSRAQPHGESRRGGVNASRIKATACRPKPGPIEDDQSPGHNLLHGQMDDLRKIRHIEEAHLG
jgi:hypothetical protein